MLDKNIKSNVDASALYLNAGYNCVNVAENGVQIGGGNGYVNDYDFGRFWRDAKL